MSTSFLPSFSLSLSVVVGGSGKDRERLCIGTGDLSSQMELPSKLSDEISQSR